VINFCLFDASLVEADFDLLLIVIKRLATNKLNVNMFLKQFAIMSACCCICIKIHWRVDHLLQPDLNVFPDDCCSTCTCWEAGKGGWGRPCFC